MHITAVDLTVSAVNAAAIFFARVLELPVSRLGSVIEVTIGGSIVRLSEGPVSSGVHHLAIDIPPAGFGSHRDWLAARVPLLHDADGMTEFEGPPGWNSRSVYFEGPDRMVLELIARRERPRTTRRVPGLLSVSEVGIAVPDVTAAIGAVQDTLGAPVLGNASDEFAPVGDHDGLLILVRQGRAWFPAFDVQAQPLPLLVQVGPGEDGTVGSPRSIQLTEMATVTTG